MITPARIYNASVLLGVGMTGTGVWVWFGLGPSLVATGALVLTMTVYMFERLVRRSA